MYTSGWSCKLRITDGTFYLGIHVTSMTLVRYATVMLVNFNRNLYQNRPSGACFVSGKLRKNGETGDNQFSRLGGASGSTALLTSMSACSLAEWNRSQQEIRFLCQEGWTPPTWERLKRRLNWKINLKIFTERSKIAKVGNWSRQLFLNIVIRFKNIFREISPCSAISRIHTAPRIYLFIDF